MTEPEMSRFMMSITQAVNLLIQACEYAQGGEVFVLKMPVVRLKDLADVVIKRVCIKDGSDPINVKKMKIGLRVGEKMFEELMSIDESNNAIELEDMYVIQSDYGKSTYPNAQKAQIMSYSSEIHSILPLDEVEYLLYEEKNVANHWGEQNVRCNNNCAGQDGLDTVAGESAYGFARQVSVVPPN